MSRWAAAATVLLGSATALALTGTSPTAIARTTGYLGLGVVLPGVVVVRGTLGRARPLLVDGTVGAAVGYGLEVFAYCLARAAGHPLWVLCWPALAVGASLLWPRLRHRVWRPSRSENSENSESSGSSVGERMATGPAWALALVATAAVGYLALGGFASSPLTGPGAATPYSDLPFHLALIGELKHHMPPATPYVSGEPLYYHWFVHAHVAATSWVTGVEPLVLLTRTELAPFAILAVLLAGVLGSRVSGSGWGGALGAALATLGGPVLAHSWSDSPFGTMELLTAGLWLSPSQSYGVVLFLAALVVLPDLVGASGRPHRIGPIVLFALLVTASAGAKATVLPLLGLGLGIALLGSLARRARAEAVTLTAALALTTVSFAGAMLVLFGGQAQGMALHPLLTLQQLPVARLLGVQPGQRLPTGVLPPIATLCLVSWLAVGAGIVGLGRRLVRDPVVITLAGAGAGGTAAALLAVQPGLSQVYFLRTAMPAVAVLSAAGLVRLSGRRGLPILAVGLAAGAALAVLVATVGPARPPKADTLGWGPAVRALAEPYAVLAGVTAAAALLALVIAAPLGRRRSWPWRRLVSAVLAGGLAAVVGLGLPVPFREAVTYTRQVTTGAAGRAVPGRPAIAPGGVPAARWLRTNSRPDELVATNAHCWAPQQRPGPPGRCDNRNFWVSAFTERRLLLEGWGYTAAANAPYQHDMTFSVNTGPFWDDALLTSNDAAFSAPSAATLDTLRDRYGVRWLFVDRRIATPVGDLGRWARLRFSAGDCEVYSLT
jgi:hypothetical protein